MYAKKKRTVTFRQTITKTVDVYGEDANEIEENILRILDNPDIIEIEHNFDDIDTDVTFISEMFDVKGERK